jgi:hypothetical protein
MISAQAGSAKKKRIPFGPRIWSWMRSGKLVGPLSPTTIPFWVGTVSWFARYRLLIVLLSDGDKVIDTAIKAFGRVVSLV